MELDQKEGGKGEYNLKMAPKEYRQAFAQRDLDLTTLDPTQAAEQIGASEVKADLVAAVDDWALFEKETKLRERLLEVARRAAPGTWSNRLRDPSCYRKAIELDPNDPHTHVRLGNALARQGNFTESLTWLKRGHELGSRQSEWSEPSADWVRRAEARVALEAKLPAFLKGELQPDSNQERLELAEVCRAKQLYHTAIGLYTAAFAADPNLPHDPSAGHQYSAACSAILAVAGRGKEAAKLDSTATAKLRAQALDWLNNQLAALTKLFDADPSQTRPFIIEAMVRWERNPDLTEIREKAALDKLSVEEQTACIQLWSDVAALLRKARTPQ